MCSKQLELVKAPEKMHSVVHVVQKACKPECMRTAVGVCLGIEMLLIYPFTGMLLIMSVNVRLNCELGEYTTILRITQT